MIRTPRGLATLALLKTRFDQGHDHLGLLEPFVADAVTHYEGESFLPSDITPGLENRTGLAIPVDTMRTVLARFASRGLLRREGGRFLIKQGTFPDPEVDAASESIETRHRSLARAFQLFASERGVSIPSEEDALAALATFIGDNKIPLLFNELLPDSPLERSALDRKMARLAARFIAERCLKSEVLRSDVESLTEGMVLQDTLLLRDLATIGQSFRELVVVLDSRVLFAALDLVGVANGIATKEGLTLLREAGARTIAFDCTIAEMQRILAVHEQHLATVEGRLSLIPTELTRHILLARLAPSDIRTISATLEKRLAAVGIHILELPKREPQHTIDEEGLAAALADTKTQTTDSPRILHDVDCIAGVLTLRAGRSSTAIEKSGAVFCSTSGRVIRNVQQWYYRQGGHGTPPIVHQFALTSIAWLKKPTAVRGVKVHELAALCAAALRPARETWEKFMENLRRLRGDQILSDDETVAIVASELTEPLLSQLDEEMEPDADTIAEAIERVRADFREEAQAVAQRALAGAQEAIRQAQAEAAIAQEAATQAMTRHGQQERRIVSHVTIIARWVSSAFFLLGGLILATSVVVAIPGVIESIGGIWRLIARGILIVAAGLGAYDVISGHSLEDLKNRFYEYIARRVAYLLYGTDLPEVPH